MSVTLQEMLQYPPFGMLQAEKEKQLLALLKELTHYHRGACAPYDQIVKLACPKAEAATSLADLPYLPISLFKFRRLRSLGEKDVRVAVTSSGTTGAQKSRIELDATTAKLASRALSAIITHALGPRRLPMLIIDTESAVRGVGGMGARAAAILGLMPSGRDHCFALRDDLSFDDEKVAAFIADHKHEEIFIYGFTFLVWQYFVEACKRNDYDFSRAVLMHSGGWKKLVDQAVDNRVFKETLKSVCGIQKVMNFYGMAELPGTIFLENHDGLLYPPLFADVIIRDPLSFQPLPQGQQGLIQILSAVPQSYPGHSLLTEDIGVIAATDSGIEGWYGKGLRVIGRAPRAEMRGCSDVIAQGGAAA